MSLSKTSIETISRFADVITKTPASTISEALKSEHRSNFRDEVLGLGSEREFSTFFAPFDHINESADIVIVGITPGVSQADEALTAFRSSLLAGGSIEDAAKRAKQSASFKGKMRDIGARLMDHFRFHEVFGMDSTIDLFGKHSGRAHYTSALRYPVLKDFKNFSGDKKLLDRPMMRKMIDELLAPELASFPNAWIIPFGPTAEMVTSHLAKGGVINEDKVLGGILHPSGTQWNRYNVQLEICSRAEAIEVPGGPAVIERSAALHNKVGAILGKDREPTKGMAA
jgi:hypothetical protein